MARIAAGLQKAAPESTEAIRGTLKLMGALKGTKFLITGRNEKGEDIVLHEGIVGDIPRPGATRSF